MSSSASGFENFSSENLPNIRCCLCGIITLSNPSNMCPDCLASVVDISEGIPKKYNIQFCHASNRYLQPPNRWMHAELDSPELLAICLKQVRGLNKVRLIDAHFLWTEPHSKRLRIKLTVQKEVYPGLILQQSFEIEFVVVWTQSPEVAASFTAHTWKAAVQVRQKVNHKRTIFFLEQVILKHKAFEKIIHIKEMPDGIDFFFQHRSHAIQFLDFISSMVPVRTSNSKELISHDASSNTYNFKFTFFCEIVPISKDDVVVIPHKLYSRGGTSSPILLCHRISGYIQLLDPFTLATGDISAEQYWGNPFPALASQAVLTEFFVVDIEYTGQQNEKMALVDVELARSNMMDDRLITRTHLGFILSPGDLVLGYDFRTLSIDEELLKSYKNYQLPDVILVRKSFADRERRRKRRNWRLKKLAKEEYEASGGKRRGDTSRAHDYDRFLEELEEDPEMRQHVQLYADPSYVESGSVCGDADEEGREYPVIGLEELMSDFERMAVDDDDDSEQPLAPFVDNEPDSGDEGDEDF